MRFSSLSEFLDKGGNALTRAPVALIFVEDLVEVESTIRYHQLTGFKSIVVFAPDELDLPATLEQEVARVDFPVIDISDVQTAVNACNDAAPDVWMYYCYNAEYLFFPFCETRNVTELLTFHTEERRNAMLAYVVDLYADDLGRYPNAVSLDHAWIDRSGYYALGRPDPANRNHPKERQLDFFGGLRWRYEEHVARDRRKIDRVALFRTKKDLRLRADHTFTDEEYNTYACPWHNNLTAAIASFRTAKALKMNSGSTFDIPTFKWHNSVPFEWTSQQLLDLGLMEPGQWF
ncbi:glycosyltransferase family 2 protein [Maritimibacter dapengensis]|uniref:Glycosyltransferase family 2 protein n=1 Tax=Maritimibacter dapengensis TaxID=2836868 RepID=A0ABS6T0N0_9RHOB|nr:glycosyltransferase family 2 protein [Maritimibacter dapengensis]MBV7378540.1 glycosyltransferase family 2 protein [Maritimibacter dapengensis]